MKDLVQFIKEGYNGKLKFENGVVDIIKKVGANRGAEVDDIVVNEYHILVSMPAHRSELIQGNVLDIVVPKPNNFYNLIVNGKGLAVDLNTLEAELDSIYLEVYDEVVDLHKKISKMVPKKHEGRDVFFVFHVSTVRNKRYTEIYACTRVDHMPKRFFRLDSMGRSGEA